MAVAWPISGDRQLLQLLRISHSLMFVSSTITSFYVRCGLLVMTDIEDATLTATLLREFPSLICNPLQSYKKNTNIPLNKTRYFTTDNKRLCSWLAMFFLLNVFLQHLILVSVVCVGSSVSGVACGQLWWLRLQIKSGARWQVLIYSLIRLLWQPGAFPQSFIEWNCFPWKHAKGD